MTPHSSNSHPALPPVHVVHTALQLAALTVPLTLRLPATGRELTREGPASGGLLLVTLAGGYL